MPGCRRKSFGSCCNECRYGLREQRAGKELAVLLLVEPRALDIEKAKAGQARERQRIERELRDRLVRSGVRLVIEDVDGAVADLEEVDVAGEDARGALLRVRAEVRAQPQARRYRRLSTKSEFRRRPSRNCWRA